MAESLHPIIEQKGLTPGTPEAVLAVAEVFVKMQYEDDPKTKDNLFGKWYGVNHVAWCAEFVSYCFNKAGAGDIVNGLSSPKGYAGCNAGIAAMKKRGYKQVTAADAQPGDIVFFDWDHNHDPDHTGIVLKNNAKQKTLTCREGNTSRGDGSRSNGGQVAQRDRAYSLIFTVFRPPYKAAAKPATAPVTASAAAPVVAPVAKPATPTAPVNTAVKPAAVKTYKVKSGDTLSGIASANKTTVAALTKLNGIKDASKIAVGQVIKLG